MGYLILLVLGLVGLLLLLFWFQRRDRSYRKKGVAETMDQQLRDRIDQETKDAMRRKSKFEEILKKRGN